MNLYRKLVPEIFRTQIRNPQYIIDDLTFYFRYILHYFIFKKPLSINHNRQLSHNSLPSVCYIIPTTNITGGVAVVCEHLNRLKKLGYKTLIASYDNKTDLSWFPKQSVKVIPLTDNKSFIESFDIVIATGWITAYELLLLNVKRKIYFVQSDETRFYPFGSYLKTRVKRTYSFPFEFMTEAKWIQSLLKEKFNKNATYIPNGINTDIFYPDTPLEAKPKSKKRVLLEGAINLPFKGMEEAFKVVQDLDCEVWCVSYYGKPKPEWHCDRFFEKVPMDMMRRIYSSCDILLKLSRVEGFFGPPLEMMACGGVPIIAKVSGYDEYIKDNFNALVSSPGNINQTKVQINKLFFDKTLFSYLLKNGNSTVKQFNWDNSINSLSTFFNNKPYIF
jgi:O-antigen biosynthesis protein